MAWWRRGVCLTDRRKGGGRGGIRVMGDADSYLHTSVAAHAGVAVWRGGEGWSVSWGPADRRL